jgi:hypothetical protein
LRALPRRLLLRPQRCAPRQRAALRCGLLGCRCGAARQQQLRGALRGAARELLPRRMRRAPWRALPRWPVVRGRASAARCLRPLALSRGRLCERYGAAARGRLALPAGLLLPRLPRPHQRGALHVRCRVRGGQRVRGPPRPLLPRVHLFGHGLLGPCGWRGHRRNLYQPFRGHLRWIRYVGRQRVFPQQRCAPAGARRRGAHACRERHGRLH